MFLAEKTVKNYVSNLLSKLGMERRTQVRLSLPGLTNGRRKRLGSTQPAREVPVLEVSADLDRRRKDGSNTASRATGGSK